MADFDKESWQYNMMGDYYKLMHDFWNITNNDEYWKSLVDAMEEFGAKYDEQSLGFSRKLALEFGNYMDKRYFKEKEKQT